MCCPNTNILHTMAVTVVHLSLLHVRNGVVFGVDEKIVRSYWFVVFEAVIGVRCSMYAIVIPPSRAVELHYNGDDGCAFIFVECMEQRCRTCWARIHRPYVLLVCGCIRSCHWCAVTDAVVISPSCAVQIHYISDDDGCAFMFVECMERCRVGRGRTASTFVLLCG